MNVAESTINDSQNPNMIELEQLSLHTLKIVAENIPSNVHQMANEVWICVSKLKIKKCQSMLRDS